MSEREDEAPGAHDDGDGDRADTVPEAPAGDALASSEVGPAPAALDGGDATAVDAEPAPQETPERAGRRVARSGLRVGTRLVLGLVLASVLPTALAAGSVLFLKQPPAPASPAPPSEPLTMAELRMALAEQKALDAWAEAADHRAAASPADEAPPPTAPEAPEGTEAVVEDEAAGVEPPAPAPAAPAEARLPPLPSRDVTRAVLVKASALAPVREEGPHTPAADLDAVRSRVVVGALVLSLFASLLLGLRLRKDLTIALSAVAARLRLLASGQPSERAATTQPSEIAELDDVADALCQTLGSLRARDEADRARAERLFSLAEEIDAVSRGQLSTRLPSSEDVAEATLAGAINRMIDAFERQVVRLKSHARLLAADLEGAPAHAGVDDDEGERDANPAALVIKRVAGLRPIPPLLTDIAGRLSTLSRMPLGEARVPDDLAKLSEAIAQRARAAQAIFDSLETQLLRLPRASSGASAALSSDQQRALQKLVEDLEGLAVDASLPRLVESLPELPASEVAARLARAVTSA